MKNDLPNNITGNKLEKVPECLKGKGKKNELFMPIKTSKKLQSMRKFVELQ